MTPVLSPGSYAWNLNAVPSAITTLGLVLLAGRVILRERGPVRAAFVSVAAAAGIWFFAVTMMALASDRAVALWWAHTAYVGVPFIPSGVYLFAMVVLRRPVEALRKARVGFELSAAVALVAVATDVLVPAVRSQPWGWSPVYSVWGFVFMAGLIAPMVYVEVQLAHAFDAAAPGAQRERLRWILIGLVVADLAIVDFLPGFGVPVYPFGYLPILVFAALIAWTVGRYHLVELTPTFAAHEILSISADPLVVCEVDGTIRHVNAAAVAVLGYPEERLVGREIGMLLDGTPDDAHPLVMGLAGQPVRDAEMLFVSSGGERIDVSVSVSHIPARDGRPLGVVVAARDIRARKRAAEALRESEERYALAARGAKDGLWDWDIRSGRIYYSAHWAEALGVRSTDMAPTLDAWLDRVHADDREQLEAELEAHLKGVTPHFTHEHRVRHTDGSWRWMLVRGLAVRGPDGKAYRIAGSQTDITERKEAEDRLLFDAFHDVLTGLANRALFMDRLGHAVSRARRQEQACFAVLFLDLDRFKLINDGLGHGTGDRLLEAIGSRLRRCVRPGDTVARFGGDEFTILLDGISCLQDATHIAERIDEELSEAFVLDGKELFAGASIGIAVGGRGYQRAEDVLRDADIAMYRAKASGRSRYVVFDPSMHHHAVTQLEMETDLRHAVDRRQLRVHYQPIVGAQHGDIRGFEALVRWEHPRLGLIGPSAFIPLAEESGLIVPIGAWVLEESCRQLRAWQERHGGDPPLTVSVNISGRQFVRADLCEQVQQALETTGLPAGCLRLEITESVLMEDVEQAIATLGELRALGVKLHMDDFGTGYSSLSYLQRFPIHTVKIDGSFVERIREDDQDTEIVRTIIALATHLGLEVVAEGVETPEQQHWLRVLRCGYLQGYLFSKPVSAAEVDDLLIRSTGRLRPKLAQTA
ncbi:MAG TPA: EAL domain-containing protein [Gemmatimonadales bacterium]|nr:EAL domain-containing protein [Gemmatimonadales bacterium]